MSDLITVHRSPPSSSTLLDRDWFGQPARHKAGFRLWLEGDRLNFRFEAEKPPQCDDSLQPGDFVEGLWLQDVAELFVQGPDGRYQELNLSPRGAWWCALFSSYRQRERVWAPQSARLTADGDQSSWSAEISVALEDLIVLPPADLNQARMNVSAILDPQRPEFLSLGHQSGGEPDFHADCNFLAITLR